MFIPTTSAQPPRLLDQFQQAAHATGHSAPTVKTLAAWVRAFIFFHDKQHPSTFLFSKGTSHHDPH